MSLLGGSALTWAISFCLGVVSALGSVFNLLPVLFHQVGGHLGDSFTKIKIVIPARRRCHQGQ